MWNFLPFAPFSIPEYFSNHSRIWFRFPRIGVILLCFMGLALHIVKLGIPIWAANPARIKSRSSLPLYQPV